MDENLRKILDGLKNGFDLPDPTDAELEAAYNAEDGSLDGYDCPRCRNRGYVWHVENGQRTAVECECMAVRRAKRRMAESGLDGLLDVYRFDNFRTNEEWQRKAAQTAQDFVQGCSEWFFMAGQPGCGKTHLCTAIVGRLIEAGSDMQYMRWVEDSSDILFSGFDDRGRKVRRFQTCELLYIDDFLKSQQGEEPSKREIRLAFEIVNHRYVNHLKTVFSSEKSPAEIMQLDEALGSRIYQRAKGATVCIRRAEGRNWRLK